MAERLGGFPYWQLRFDVQGDSDPSLRKVFLAGLPDAELTDLFVISHGWNNDPRTAEGLYQRFFAHVETLLGGRAGDGRVGVVGVVWPSMAWLDEPIPDFEAAAAGGAAALGQVPASDGDLVRALGDVFDAPQQRAELEELARLLDDRPDDPARLADFHAHLRALTETEVGSAPQAADEEPEEDVGELTMLTDDPQAVYGRFLAAGELLATGLPSVGDDEPAARLRDPAPLPVDGAAAGLGDRTARLWSGARAALRQATYFMMKRRAGAVGRRGLGPLLGAAAEAAPGLRLHLVGHSFGARLVSYALAGLPPADPSPVKSVLLLQGAFSHFTFASSLPHDPGRAGGLAGRAGRVDGPIVSCYSVHDTAVGVLYPLASFSSREDASRRPELAYRWGAIGHDGAQAVDADQVDLQPVGGRYRFAPGRRFLNVDARSVVRRGRPPSGAHSDIFHPELAWLAVSAAGLDGR